MLSSYPPGVTGHEPEFGADEEFSEERFCNGCDEETQHGIWRYGCREVSECRECLHETETHLGPDPD